jgi:hypothetical protein
MPVLGVCPTFLLGSRESLVPDTLCANFVGPGLAYLGGALFAGVPIDGLVPPSWAFRRGDSGRGSDGRDFFPPGLGALLGPTDWLKFGTDGVGGVNVIDP